MILFHDRNLDFTNSCIRLFSITSEFVRFNFDLIYLCCYLLTLLRIIVIRYKISKSLNNLIFLTDRRFSRLFFFFVISLIDIFDTDFHIPHLFTFVWLRLSRYPCSVRYLLISSNLQSWNLANYRLGLTRCDFQVDIDVLCVFLLGFRCVKNTCHTCI